MNRSDAIVLEEDASEPCEFDASKESELIRIRIVISRPDLPDLPAEEKGLGRANSPHSPLSSTTYTPVTG